MKAVLCPVCLGSGAIAKTHEEMRNDEMRTAQPPRHRRCHGCCGCGWVTVQESKPYIPMKIKEVK